MIAVLAFGGIILVVSAELSALTRGLLRRRQGW